MRRKIRIIKERGTNVQMPQSKVSDQLISQIDSEMSTLKTNSNERFLYYFSNEKKLTQCKEFGVE